MYVCMHALSSTISMNVLYGFKTPLRFQTDVSSINIDTQKTTEACCTFDVIIVVLKEKNIPSTFRMS